MQGLYLLTGHVFGDVVWQNDWMTANKAKDDKACAIHCGLYVLAVFMFCGSFLPWWAFLLIAVVHYPVDRYGLARRMMAYLGRERSITASSSVTAVEHVIHLTTLSVVTCLATTQSLSSLFGPLLFEIAAIFVAMWTLRHLPSLPPDPVPDQMTTAMNGLSQALTAIQSVIELPMPAPSSTELPPLQAIPMPDGRVEIKTHYCVVVDLIEPRVIGSVPRVRIAALPGDTWTEWSERLDQVAAALVSEVGLKAMQALLKRRYEQWAAIGDSMLDRQLEPVSHIIPGAKYTRMRAIPTEATKTVKEQPKNEYGLQPLTDRVLVKHDVAEKVRPSGLILPDSVKEPPCRGTVIAAGPGKYSEKLDAVIPLDVVVGDRVLFTQWAGTKVPGHDNLSLMRSEDIMATVNEE